LVGILGALVAALGASANDSSGGTTIQFQQCDLNEVHFMFALDMSGSMKKGSPRRIDESLQALRDILYSIYKDTTFLCLEWESRNNVLGGCQNQGFTVMRFSLSFWSQISKTYKEWYNHANFKRLWYEYSMYDTSFFATNYPDLVDEGVADIEIPEDVGDNQIPIMTHLEIRKAYGLLDGETKLSGDDLEQARNDLLEIVRQRINAIRGRGNIIPNAEPDGLTEPGLGTHQMRQQVENDMNPNGVNLVTFLLTDGSLMYGYEGQAQRDQRLQITNKYTIGEQIMRPDYTAMTNTMENGNGKAQHYGLGIRGSKQGQALLFDGAGIDFEYFDDIGEIIGDIREKLLKQCRPCTLNLQTYVVSGEGCGGEDDNGSGAQVDGEEYMLVIGKKSDPTSTEYTVDTCETTYVAVSDYNQTTGVTQLTEYEDVLVCKKKMFHYCARINDPTIPVDDAFCGFYATVSDPYVLKSAQTGPNETNDCDCTCPSNNGVTLTVGEDYFCDPNLVESATAKANVLQAVVAKFDADDSIVDPDLGNPNDDDDGDGGVTPKGDSGDSGNNGDNNAKKPKDGSGMALSAPIGLTMIAVTLTGLFFA